MTIHRSIETLYFPVEDLGPDALAACWALCAGGTDPDTALETVSRPVAS